MREAFDRIVSLPPERSDNAGRISRVTDFARARFGATRVPRLLDIGAGLGVFPFAVKNVGWDCIALDPDSRAATHLRAVVGVSTVTGDFFSSSIDELGLFDVITLNKVIEHVEDPVAMLARAKMLLKVDGFVYVEVPDVLAATEGGHREEYFIEHHHVFSPASTLLCGERAGLTPIELQRIREPSGKFSIVCFLENSFQCRN
jgi:SAM-dependent methyltransferase